MATNLEGFCLEINHIYVYVVSADIRGKQEKSWLVNYTVNWEDIFVRFTSLTQDRCVVDIEHI